MYYHHISDLTDHELFIGDRTDDTRLGPGSVSPIDSAPCTDHRVLGCCAEHNMFAEVTTVLTCANT